jgi:hypothetical protein
MTADDNGNIRAALWLLCVLFAAIGAFFLFYTIRLLVVTDLLRHTRAGGAGAFAGAVVFPLLAIGCAWVSYRTQKRARSLAAH